MLPSSSRSLYARRFTLCGVDQTNTVDQADSLEVLVIGQAFEGVPWVSPKYTNNCALRVQAHAIAPSPGLLHRQLSCLRLRDRALGPPRCLYRNTTDELVHWRHHRGRRLLRVQPAQRSVGVARASGPPVALPGGYQRLYILFRLLIKSDTASDPHLVCAGVALVVSNSADRLHRDLRHSLDHSR